MRCAPGRGCLVIANECSSSILDFDDDQITILFNTSITLLCNVDGDGDVDVTGVLAMLVARGPSPDPPLPRLADLDDDGHVNVSDLQAAIEGWTA